MAVIHDESQIPWLKNGDLCRKDGRLHVLERRGRCNHCGECCKGNVWKHLSPEQRAEYEAAAFNGGYCYWYDRAAQRCRIYYDRPQYCFLFPQTPDQMPAECAYDFKLVEIGVLA